MKIRVLILTIIIMASCASKQRASENMKTPESTEMLCGGYSPESTEISAESLALFQSLIADSENKNLVPISVSTQVVAGMNYNFVCKDSVTNKSYEVIIYKPLPGRGDPSITSINESTDTEQ